MRKEFKKMYKTYMEDCFGSTSRYQQSLWRGREGLLPLPKLEMSFYLIGGESTVELKAILKQQTLWAGTEYRLLTYPILGALESVMTSGTYESTEHRLKIRKNHVHDGK